MTFQGSTIGGYPCSLHLALIHVSYTSSYSWEPIQHWTWLQKFWLARENAHFSSHSNMAINFTNKLQITSYEWMIPYVIVEDDLDDLITCKYSKNTYGIGEKKGKMMSKWRQFMDSTQTKCGKVPSFYNKKPLNRQLKSMCLMKQDAQYKWFSN